MRDSGEGCGGRRKGEERVGTWARKIRCEESKRAGIVDVVECGAMAAAFNKCCSKHSVSSEHCFLAGHYELCEA